MIFSMVGISPILDQLTNTRGIFCYGLICSSTSYMDGIEELGYGCFSASGGVNLGPRAWVLVVGTNSYGPGFLWDSFFGADPWYWSTLSTI